MTQADVVNPDPEAAAYFDGLRRGLILVQHCPDCDRRQFPPRAHCGECGSRGPSWEEIQGAGVVYAKTVNRRAPESAFEKFLPYAVALVDLDAGVRVMARADCPADEVATGVRARVFPDPDPVVAPGLLFIPEQQPGRGGA